MLSSRIEGTESSVADLLRFEAGDEENSSLLHDDVLGVSYPTAQSSIYALVEWGDLTETTGRRRNRFYFAARIFEAVYGGLAAPPEQPTLFDQ